MVLVFILCTIVIITTLLICVIIFSTIRINIEHFYLSNMKEVEKEKNIKQNYKVTISLNLFNKLKWAWIEINKKKLDKMYSKMHIEEIDFKKIEQNFKLGDLKELKKLKPKVDYFDLNFQVGLEDAVATSFIVFLISTIISIILPHTIKEYKKEKYKYNILPVYINQNVYKIKFDGIIEIKMVHIINIIYVIFKKRRVDNNEQRSSNRRAYGYSYE